AIVSGGLFMLLGHWIGEKLMDPAAQKKIHEFKEIALFAAGFLACGVIVFIIWRKRNVQRLHDVEARAATRVIAAETAATDKTVQVVKKPPAAETVQPPSPSLSADPPPP